MESHEDITSYILMLELALILCENIESSKEKWSSSCTVECRGELMSIWHLTALSVPLCTALCYVGTLYSPLYWQSQTKNYCKKWCKFSNNCKVTCWLILSGFWLIVFYFMSFSVIKSFIIVINIRNELLTSLRKTILISDLSGALARKSIITRNKYQTTMSP